MIIVWSNPSNGDMHIGVCDVGCNSAFANSSSAARFAEYPVNGWGYPAGDFVIYDPQHIP
jgi:hypothetical protein